MTHTEAFIDILDRLRRLPMGPAFKRLSEMGLSPTHIRAMQILHGQALLPMKDLAEQLQITPPSVTAVVRRLASNKLVERHPDPEDSRKVLLALSEYGTQLFSEIQQAHHQRIEQLLNGLNPAEREQLIDLMGRAVAALEITLAGGRTWNE